MAFRLPDQTVQRPLPYSATAQPSPLQTSQSQSNLPQEEDESREWVLFSPGEETPSTITRTDTTSTERTPRTAGLSRFSDLGSLNTAAWSSGPGQVASRGIDDVQASGSLDDDNNTELDSLDDGLPAFREPVVSEPVSDRLFQSDPAILPAHDGLGTFSPSGLQVQEQLWNHEQYNLQRASEARPRRRSSVQRHLDVAGEPQGIHMERERWQRVEQWRVEQSRALLQEIEKETRRRQRKRVGVGSKASRSTQQPAARDVTCGPTISQSVSSGRTTNRHKPSPYVDETGDGDTDESFWQRITRKVIKELMGIDDSLLSVIFGESLVLEAEGQNEQKDTDASEKQASDSLRPFTRTTDLSPADIDEAMKDVADAPRQNEQWKERLVERISRELGILVHQLCEHPGAFTTYLRAVDSASNEYAGMPVSQPAPLPPAPIPQLSSKSASYSDTQDSQSVHSPKFIPTLQQDPATTRHAALWGIEEEEQPPATNLSTRDGQPLFQESERLEREREYWERELDIKMVFRYLRSRFAGQSAPVDSNSTSPPPQQQQQQRIRRQESTSSRAAIIRQHHPLVARAEANARVRRPSPVLHHRIRRPSSSCASQTRLSVSTKKTLGGSGSSRHYWDIGGSVGSSGAPVAVGGMGSWGDA